MKSAFGQGVNRGDEARSYEDAFSRSNPEMRMGAGRIRCFTSQSPARLGTQAWKSEYHRDGCSDAVLTEICDRGMDVRGIER